MAVTLGETKVNAIDKVAVAASCISDKVGWFDITVDQMTGVHQLDALQHLISNHEDRFEGESTTTLIELIFKGRSKQIHHHEIVGILRSKVVNLGEARGILQLAVDLVLMAKLRASSAVFLEFYSDLKVTGRE